MKKLLLIMILFAYSANLSLSAQGLLEGTNIKRHQLSLNLDNWFSDNEMKTLTYTRHWKKNMFWGASLGSDFNAKKFDEQSREYELRTQEEMQEGRITQWIFFIPIWESFEFDLSEEADVFIDERLTKTHIAINPFVRKVYPLGSNRVVNLFFNLGTQIQYNETFKRIESHVHEVEYSDVVNERGWTGVPFVGGEYTNLQHMTRFDSSSHFISVERLGNKLRLNPFVDAGFMLLSKEGFGLETAFHLRRERSDFKSDWNFAISYAW